MTLAEIEKKLQEFQTIVDTKDKQEVPIKQQEILELVENVERDMVGKFPFQIPKEYDSNPLLLGRASVEMKVNCKQSTQTKGGIMKIVVDGYNAPVTAGNFVDLIERKFYDGMSVQVDLKRWRTEGMFNLFFQRADGFVVQSGDPGNKQTGLRAILAIFPH